MSSREGDEILPIEYSDNYVTVFGGETVEVEGVVPTSGVDADWVRVTGYNSPPVVSRGRLSDPVSRRRRS